VCSSSEAWQSVFRKGSGVAAQATGGMKICEVEGRSCVTPSQPYVNRCSGRTLLRGMAEARDPHSRPGGNAVTVVPGSRDSPVESYRSTGVGVSNQCSLSLQVQQFSGEGKQRKSYWRRQSNGTYIASGFACLARRHGQPPAPMRYCRILR